MLKRFFSSAALVLGISMALTSPSRAGEYGPAGGNGGRNFYYVSPNGYFTEIDIRSARRIDGLWFISDDRGSSQYGGDGGDRDLIGIGGQCIAAIAGTTSLATNKRSTPSIFSIEFIFSDGTSTGRYGRDGDDPFFLSAPRGEEIVGFFGRHGTEIDAIGIVTGPSRCS